MRAILVFCLPVSTEWCIRTVHSLHKLLAEPFSLTLVTMLPVARLIGFALLGRVLADITCTNNIDNGTTYTSAAGSLFDVTCGTDYFGGDLSSIAGVTFQQCVEQCDTTTGCVDVAFVEGGGNCYMKNQLTPPISNPNVWSARKRTDTTTAIDPEALSCDTLGTNGTFFNATTGSEYQILCGLDYGGGDLTSTQTPNFAGCIEACEKTDGCIDVSYVYGACYMKSVLNIPNALPYVWTAKLTKSAHTRSQAVSSLSCNIPAVNQTTYTTSGNRTYEILCGIDHLAGDMGSTTAATFELCLEACDAAQGCVDIAYVGQSCYLKNSLGPAVVKDWVWNARYIAPTTSTTSSSSLPTASYYGNSTNTTTTSSTAANCAVNTTNFFPAANQVNGNDYSLLTPKTQITLTYANPTTQRAIALGFLMNLPTVVLEDSNYIDGVTCGPNIQVSLTDTISYDMASTWPTTGFLIITYFPGCNSQAERGIYYVSKMTLFPLELVVGLQATQVNLTDVATEMTVGFGSFVGNATSLTSTCNTGVNATTPPRFVPPANTSLSSDIQGMVAALSSVVKYDASGAVDIQLPVQTAPVIVTPDSFDAADTVAQAALKLALADAGLPQPAAVAAQVSAALSGSCPASNSTATAVKSKARRLAARSKSLTKRKHQSKDGEESEAPKYSAGSDVGDDADAWEYACNDAVTSFTEMFGAAGKIYDGVCEGHDAFQAGQSIDCILTGCDHTETTTTTTVVDVAPPTKYSFLNSWSIAYPNVANYPQPLDVAPTGPQSGQMSCVNCAMNVNLIQFDGAITVDLTSQQVVDVDVDVGISWDADHVVNIQADGPWADSWEYVFNANSFDGIGVPGIFSITPSMIYSIAYSWSTDSAVNVTAGAHLHVGNATANTGSGSVSDPSSFMPEPSFIYPVFSTGAKVSMSLVMQALVSMSINIMGQISITTSQTIQNTIGMNSEYSKDAVGACPANNLAVKSYVSTNNTLSINDGTPNMIYAAQSVTQPRCFSVPQAVPDSSELAALASVGGPFCTSYLQYTPTSTWTVSTSTVPDPTIVYTTVTSTTVWDDTVINVFSTYRTTLTATSTVLSSTSYVYTSGSYSLPSQYLKRDSYPTPTASASAHPKRDIKPLHRRQIAIPGVASSWSPGMLSYACSQIATGASTSTYTAVVYDTSGTTTDTYTHFVGVQGPVLTQLITTSQSLTLATTTVTSPGVATSTVTTDCPFQTTASCMRIYGHGPPHLEGLPLAYNPDYDGADALHFGLDPDLGYTETAWYLSSDGSLQAIYNYTASQLINWFGGAPQIGNYLSGNFTTIVPPNSVGYGIGLAVCTKNCATKTLQCCYEDICTWYVVSVNMDLDWFYSTTSQTPYSPLWGPVNFETGNPNLVEVPLSLTYEDIQCPCPY